MKLFCLFGLLICLYFVTGVTSFAIPGWAEELSKSESEIKNVLHKFNNNPKTVSQCEASLTGLMSTLGSANCSENSFKANISNVSNSDPYSYSNVSDAMAAYCAKCNPTSLKTLLTATKASGGKCTGEEQVYVSVEMQIDKSLLACFKSGSTYCFEELFWDGYGDDNQGGDETAPNQTELATFCNHTCYAPVITYIQSSLPCLSAYQHLAVICLQDDDGEYCFEDIKEFEINYFPSGWELLNSSMNTSFNTELADFCESGCSSILTKEWDAIKTKEASNCKRIYPHPRFNYYGHICDVNKAGHYCTPIVKTTNFTSFGNFSACQNEGVSSNWSTCNAECITTQKAITAALGCCYNTVYEMFTGALEVPGVKTWVETKCGVDPKVIPTCASIGPTEAPEKNGTDPILEGSGYRTQPATLIILMVAAAILILLV